MCWRIETKLDPSWAGLKNGGRGSLLRFEQIGAVLPSIVATKMLLGDLRVCFCVCILECVSWRSRWQVLGRARKGVYETVDCTSIVPHWRVIDVSRSVNSFLLSVGLRRIVSHKFKWGCMITVLCIHSFMVILTRLLLAIACASDTCCGKNVIVIHYKRTKVRLGILSSGKIEAQYGNLDYGRLLTSALILACHALSLYVNVYGLRFKDWYSIWVSNFRLIA